MSTAETIYAELVELLAGAKDVEVGQMFGKPCMKVGGKAFVAHQKEVLAFKLTASTHAKALAITGAKLWDPSGAGRPMKEWVAVPGKAKADFKALAKDAMAYVKAGK
jgi:hypothetical protein